jgi:glycosyltransferase involved in cell wall biosynthesis
MPDQQKLHILFIASWFPTRKQQTLGNFVERHARAVSRKHKVTVLHTVADASIKKDEWVHVREGNYNAHILYHRPSKPEWLFRAVHFKRAWKAMRGEEQIHPDVIHLNVVYPAGQHALTLSKELKVPFIVTEHWTGYHEDTHNSIRPWQRRMMQKVARKTSMICPVSDHLGAAMQRNGMVNNYTTVPNVVNTDLFQIGNAEKQSERPHFLHVSSLFDQHKNVSGLLRGFARLIVNHPEAFLEVLGDGDPEPHKAYAVSLGIPEGNISFAGEQPLEVIASKMRGCSALVLFSNYENLPCVIGEAWASGTPVISTDVGGIAEHLNEERGYLIPKGDEGELTLAMSYLIRDPNRFDAHELRQYAVDHFSEAAIAQAYDAVYQKVIRAHTT